MIVEPIIFLTLVVIKIFDNNRMSVYIFIQSPKSPCGYGVMGNVRKKKKKKKRGKRNTNETKFKTKVILHSCLWLKK
jgi:hypothetical protein